MVLISTEAELEAFGEKEGRRAALATRGNRAQVFALAGELGAGKTTFTRGFARGLGVVRRIASPTFVIARRYDVVGGRTFWHVDAYRLRGAEDLPTIDWEELVADPNNVIVLEWADRVREGVPDNSKWLEFIHHPQGREVTVGVKAKRRENQANKRET